MKRNLFALIVLLVILVAFPAAIFAYRARWEQAPGTRVIEIQARAPEAGGFAPDRVELTAGETVRLRLVSPDVVHGFSIPGLGVDVEEVYPGKPIEVTITPRTPGRYAFACTRWCSVDHWRMRGVIEVRAGEDQARPPAEQEQTLSKSDTPGEPPMYERLGIDIDAMRHAPAALPPVTPSAQRGAQVAQRGGVTPLPGAVRPSMSPEGAFEQLRAAPGNTKLSDGEVWDLVAWGWLSDVSPAAFSKAQALYSRDCAACHGEAGRGDGVAGRNLPGMSKMEPAMRKGPADFTNAGQMLSAPDALLEGKILRGGMGTGMPEFGSLYTDEELWAMVSYLRTFLFTK